MAGRWSRHRFDDRPAEIAAVGTALDPVLVPLGFAPAQAGATGGRGQVIYCRGVVDGGDGACLDLVIDLVADPGWRVEGVRYWGFTSDRWRLAFDREAPLPIQLAGLARSLPGQLA